MELFIITKKIWTLRISIQNDVKVGSLFTHECDAYDCVAISLSFNSKNKEVQEAREACG